MYQDPLNSVCLFFYNAARRHKGEAELIGISLNI